VTFPASMPITRGNDDDDDSTARAIPIKGSTSPRGFFRINLTASSSWACAEHEATKNEFKPNGTLAARRNLVVAAGTQHDG